MMTNAIKTKSINALIPNSSGPVSWQKKNKMTKIVITSGISHHPKVIEEIILFIKLKPF